jgi:hypothetical protein
MLMKKNIIRVVIFLMLLILSVLTVSACELKDESEESTAKYYINDNDYNETLKNTSTKEDAIDNVDDGITNLRSYLNQTSIATTGYYMGVEFNINTLNPETLDGGNFCLKIQAHLYTYPYEDDDGNTIYKYYDKKTGTYYDEQNEEGTRVLTNAEDIHNETIKKSDILIEWYDGVTNEMLIGIYYDGINNNSDDPGNILYLNIQGEKRYFEDFGDTVLYRQMIRLLTSLSVENLLVAGNAQDDAGVSTIRSLFEIAVNDNYKIVLNDPITSTLFYNIAADALADSITDVYQGLFSPFEDKIDPFTLKYLGFKFSIMAEAALNTVNSDMQFFTQLNNEGTSEIMTGAYITFDGTSTSAGDLFDYVADMSFEYGVYPPEDMELDKDYYTLFENGCYEFVGNLYIPMLNSNYDALIRTDMQKYDNSTNNVFTEFRDIANGELMIGTYYKNELSYLNISGLEYLYGAIALDELGFPKVYDDSLNLADALASLSDMVDEMIISIVDGILSPDQNDKENMLLEYIMDKMEATEKTDDDIFSKNTETLTVDMELIKHALEETGNGTFTTRQIINIMDSFSPYSMDQIATIMGVSSAEVMLDKTYFTFCLDIDTNEMTVKLFTDVGVESGESSTLIFQLDVTPTYFGEYVDIAEVDFDDYNPLGQIYTYSATLDGNFMFSTAEEVDLSYLLGATIGDSSGKNTVYQLDQETGVSFTLTYDQYVLDQEIDGVFHEGGRSSFDLEVWLTGEETTILLRLASDDVAFNNEVYDNLPESEDELGYVWVDIQCIYESDGITRNIPKVKIREDVFMASMQAYMNNTSIEDDASTLGESDLNLSITTILFALMKDSYVVAQPEKIEITSSNETLQNLFRVSSLIGNIKADAGFTTRVEGLAGIKDDYYLYKVGQFEDMEVYSPYSEDAILHDTITTYFYEDYIDEYDPFKYEFRVGDDGTMQVYYEGKYYDPLDGFYYYEQRYITETQTVDGVETEVDIPQRTQVEFGIVTVSREAIEYSGDSFFTSQDSENQDITKIRFDYDDLKELIYVDDGQYFYYDYSLNRVDIDEQYIKIEGDDKDEIYIYWLGIQDRLYYDSGTEYYFYNDNLALTDDDGEYVYIEIADDTYRNYLFDYDEDSIEITNEAITQYAPRIEGSFMGEVRRYYLTITSPYPVERCLVIDLNNYTYYSDADEYNVVEIYDDDGVKISEELIPIPLYVMEPAEDLIDEVETVVSVGYGEELYTHNASWDIDWDSVTLGGYMAVTTVTVAPSTMGEISFPVRIIVSNREITSNEQSKTVDLYDTNSEIKAENVPVVDSIEIDPYDYIIAKYEYFMDTQNFNPTLYSVAELDEKLELAEEAFNIEFFGTYEFTITFDAENSVLREEGVDEDYIYKSYTNVLTDNTMEQYDWYLDEYDDSNQNIESKINPDGGIIYLHTYFKGQLIALRVEIGQRTFTNLKFEDTDDYETIELDGIEINGNYMANYYDEESFTVPTTPIFVFTDEIGKTYEKVFDFNRVYGLDDNGNYLTSYYEIEWSDTTITNIGSMGSYYYDDGVLVNRPFYISNVERNENGEVISEELPTETSNHSDIDTSSLNLAYSMCIYKYDDNGDIITIPMIDETNNTDWFKEIVLRVQVECPQLNVDDIGTVEYDEVNDVSFTPTAISIGSTTIGYYQIDPLNTETQSLPTTIEIYFQDSDGERVSSHTFSGIEWANYDESNEVIIYDASTEEYIFNLSTETPMTTQAIARIGNAVSGYQDITLCIKVLSKDPQKVEFYLGETSDETNKIDDVEEISVTMGDLAYYEDTTYVVTSNQDYVSYAYYVDTFSDFELPTYLLATFGTTDTQRTEEYATDWQLVYSDETPAYSPNSVVNLVTVIGDGDVVINIYLSVIVENYTISRIDLNSDLQNYYVKVGDNVDFEYKTLASLYQTDILSENKLGFYSDEDGTEKYIVISTGSTEDGLVEIGEIGLYLSSGEDFVLQAQMYPYEFITELYSNMDIIFNQAENTDLWDFDYEYEDIYVYVNDGGSNTISQKLIDIASLQYVYDVSSQKDTVVVSYNYNDGIDDYYLVEEENSLVYIYPDMNMTDSLKIAVSLQSLTNALILLEMSSDTLVTSTIVEAYSIKNDNVEYVDFDGAMVGDIYGYLSGEYTFYDKDLNEVTFQYINIDGYGIMSYEEFIYRLTNYRNHRITGYTPTKITGKETTITNIEGIFSVNDIVISQTEEFTESENYKISIGTGTGSYDLGLKLLFSGGLRNSVSSESISVYAYNSNGYAQYGTYGYVLNSTINTSIVATKQDASLEDITYIYGYNSEKLVNWYVEYSEFDEVVEGTMITTIPQSIVYENTNNILILSTLTTQGFRITRTFEFKGVSDNIATYDSVDGNLEIDNGVIYIEDIYDYYPLYSYFAANSNLPSTIEITTDEQTLRVSDIVWNISSVWNDGTNGNMYDMTYMGTYNSIMESSSDTVLAEAQILGWTSVEDGESIQNDTINIQLYINIDNAEIISLPWEEKNPKLDTTTIIEDGENIFVVDVDAYNDSTSSAIDGDDLELPTSIMVEYSSGIVHTFTDVVYTFRNIEIEKIPYSIEGIDLVSIAYNLSLAQEYFNSETIDLQVDLGLEQTITIRFRFYDKTIVSVVAVVALDDSDIRSEITSAISTLSNAEEDNLIDMFNLTRIETNIETLVNQAKLIREAMVIPTTSEITPYIYSVSELRDILKNAFYDNVTTFETVTYPETTPYDSEACWNYAYNIFDEYLSDDANLTSYISNIQKYKSNNTKMLEYVSSLYSDMCITCYEQIIYEYVQEELVRVLYEETINLDVDDLNYAVYYKNVLEAKIDVESIIKEVYGANELYDCGAYTLEELETAITAIFTEYIDTAIYDAQKATDNDSTMSDIINNIFKTQIGLIATYSEYRPLSTYTVEYFIGNYLDYTKVEMRETINEMINQCMDYSLEDALTSDMGTVLDLAIKQAYANTASLATSISAIRSNVTTDISSTTAIETLFERAISSYVDGIYNEVQIGIEIKRVQDEGILNDSYYIVDPYGNYLYIPTELIADFDEETGGFSYTFTVNWSNDTLSNNSTYTGNAKADEYAFVEMWLEIYDTFEEDENAIAYLDYIYDNNVVTDTWDEVKANNLDIYNILMNIENNLTSTFDSYGIYDDTATTDEKALCIYNYYIVGAELYNRASEEPDAVNENGELDSDEIIRCYEEFKYTTLTGSLYLSSTMESQSIRFVVEVIDRSVDSGDIEIKDEDGIVYTDFVIDNPFTTTEYDLPSIVEIDGTEFSVIWKNVNISPIGNLSSTNRVIYGNIKNSNGQQVSMTLTVNKWAYTTFRRVTGTTDEGEDVFTRMDSSGYLKFYFNTYQEYSSEDYYQIVFNVSSLDSDGEIETESRAVIFYPEDSRLLVNTTNDEEMDEVKLRENYIIYWDSAAKTSVISEDVSSAEGSVSIGNEIVGSYTLTRLIDTTVTGVVTEGIYYNEEMVIDKIQLISLDQSATYYDDVSEYLLKASGEVPVIMDAESTFPLTGTVEIYDGNVDYSYSDIKVRIIWNSGYDTAISRLEGFVKYTYTDVATNEVTEKAKNILMNYDRTESELEELLEEAIAYCKYYYNCSDYDTNKESAYELLCIYEKYDFEDAENFLNGGTIGNQTATVIVQVGSSTALYKTTITTMVIFSDYTPKGYYYLTDSNISENDPTNYTEFSPVQESNLPDTVYIAVRSSYWDSTENTNSYTVEGLIKPYGDNYMYKLLDMYNEIDESGAHLSTMNLIKVTDIIYGSESNGQISSTSFTIDGVVYNSNLISLTVA